MKAQFSILTWAIGLCLVSGCAAALMIFVSCSDDSHDPDSWEEDWEKDCEMFGGTSLGPEGGMIPVSVLANLPDGFTVEVIPDGDDFWGCF